MKEIFEKSLELNSKITDMAGKCDIISIDVNSVMQTYQESKEAGMKTDKFMANRYLELVEELAKYGIVNKEW